MGIENWTAACSNIIPILLGLNCKIYFVNWKIKIILILLYETNMYLCVCEFQKSKY